jgi:hypothetical protein
MVYTLKLTRRIEETPAKCVENHYYLIFCDTPKPEDLKQLSEELKVDIATLASENLSDGVKEAIALLRKAIDKNTDSAGQLKALESYYQQVDELWKMGTLRTDAFQNLVVLIKAALAQCGDLTNLTEPQLSALIDVTQVLSEQMILHHTIGKCDEALFAAGVNTSPQITDLERTLVNV